MTAVPSLHVRDVENELKWWIRNIFGTFAPIKLPTFGLAIFSDAN